MRDPHVVAIHYMAGSGEGISYGKPAPISFSTALGVFALDEMKLRIEPCEHFPDESQAREAFDPFLRAWEIESDLARGIGTIRFTFDRVELIDRDPPPPGSSQVIQVKAASMVMVGSSVTLHVTRNEYPQPPNAFRATPEVQLAHRRWLGYRSEREPLQSMAYFILTLLESAAGSRSEAAKSFHIEPAVLQTIGKLSTTKGDPSTARKAGGRFLELTGAEKQWLETAIPLVIRRLGEHASGANLNRLSMTDLPKI